MNFSSVTFETSFGNIAQFFPSDRPEVVFTGRSNVGKSSLINKLCNRKNLARVGQTPGKTETVNFYLHESFRLVDLPGYGYAKRAKSRKDDWGDLMEYYFKSGRDIRLIVALIDIRHSLSETDEAMFDFLFATGLPFVIAATKADKLNKTELSDFKSKFPDVLAGHMIAVSSENGMGVDDLRFEITDAVSQGVK